VRGNLLQKTLLTCIFIIVRWWKLEWGDLTSTGKVKYYFYLWAGKSFTREKLV
jgi:hypothetical protein